MTYKKTHNRDYRAETAYESQPEQVHNRVLRNAARREAMAKGLVHKHDGIDIDHRHMLKDDPADPNAPGNLRPRSIHANRGWRKGLKGAL